MRADFSDEQTRSAIYDLFDTSFPRLSDRIAVADRLGAVWHTISTPFVAFDKCVAVAHVGVIEIPMVVAGVRRTVAGVHAVCTRPEYRGRGHIRSLLTEALAYIDERYDVAILATAIPDLYALFGFRVMPENVFSLSVTSRRRAASQARQIDDTNLADVRLVHELLQRREPVSDVMASVDSGWLFLIDEVLTSWGLRRLYYLEDLDAIVAFEMRDETLTMLDIVSSRVPPLPAVLERIPAEFDRVELLFTPDRVDAGYVERRASEPDDLLMVRGAFPVDEPFMLSHLARC